MMSSSRGGLQQNNTGGGNGGCATVGGVFSECRSESSHNIDCLRLTDCLPPSLLLPFLPSYSSSSLPRLTAAAALSGGGRAGATSAPVIFAYSKCLSLFNDAERRGQV